MQPLTTTCRMMTWLLMCSPDESTTPGQRRAHLAYSVAILIADVACFIASLACCWEFISIDFDSAIFAFMIAIGQFGLIYFMIAAILMSHQIDRIFASLSTIYNCNEGSVTFRHLVRANNRDEWMWTFYKKYIAAIMGSEGVSVVLSVLYWYFTKGDPDHLYRPAKYVLPWNQATPTGYFAEVFVSFPMTYAYMITNGTHLLFFISLCVHHRSFFIMFKQKINEAEQCDANLLCDLVRFHVSAKNFFIDSANLYRQFVLIQLICNAAFMTISVFYLDLQWHHLNFTVATVVSTASVGISTLLFYCFFGQSATESYEMMSDRVYKMSWYEQPNELQKYFILMIANMQKLLYYHGFEVARLNLETFVQLCKSVVSYYMAIKALSSR